jgi:hypothetical protein
MRAVRKRHSFVDTLKGPVSTSRPKELRPTTAAKYIAIYNALFKHGYELDWADTNQAVFLRGKKQVTLFVPPSY